MQTNDVVSIPKGDTWSLIENTSTNYDIQNTTGVLVEYSYNNTSPIGSILKPFDTLSTIKQNIYVRLRDYDGQNGLLSITRRTILPFAFPNTLIDVAEQGTMTLPIGGFGNVVTFISKSNIHNVTSKLTGFRFSVDIPDGSNLYGEVVFQLVGVGSFTGTPTYIDIDTNNSCIAYDHTNLLGSNVNITTSKSLLSESISYVSVKSGGNVGYVSIDAEQLGAVASSGDMFALVAKNQGNVEVKVRVVLNWVELS